MDLLQFYTGCMKKLDKRILDSQIVVFCEWARRHGIGVGDRDRRYLELFAIHSVRTDIEDVTDEDIELFTGSQIDGLTYPRQQESAKRVVSRMKRYYAARTKQGSKRTVSGRPPHIGEIAQVQEYRKMRNSKGKPLTLKEISSLMGGKAINLVHRWIKYPLNEHQE